MASRTITIHLAKDGLERYEDALKADLEFTTVEPAGGDPANPVLFLRLQDAHPPRWAALLSEGFDLSQVDLDVKSASAVMFLRVADRIFALAFGHGYAMLDEAAFVEDFGLKVALSTISPERLRNVDIVRPEAFALRKRQQTGRSSTLAEFDFDQLLDIIKSVTGRTETPDFATKLTGSNSLKLSSELSFDQIPQKCERALVLYNSDAYQEHFGLIDHLRPVRDPIRVQELDRSLLEYLTAGATDHVFLSPPEIIDEASIAGFKYGGTRDRAVYPDLDIDIYLGGREGNEISIELLKNHKNPNSLRGRRATIGQMVDVQMHYF
jgi:uncharacterized protein (TIGR04141 family)